MIITSIKNFFKSLGLYFIPLGVISFFIMIALSAMIPDAIALTKGTFETIASKVSSAKFDWDAIQGLFFNKFLEVSKNPAAFIETISSSDGMLNLLKEITKSAFGTEALTEEIIGLLQGLVVGLMSYILILFVIFIIAFFIGFLLLKILTRKFLTNSNILKVLLVSLFDSAVAVGVICLLTETPILSLDVWKWFIIAGIVIAFAILSLFEAYLFYGIGKVKFKEVVNFKNFLTFLLGNLIIFAVGAGVVALLMLIPNRTAAVMIVIPFIELVVCVFGLNAEVYVSDLSREVKILKKAEVKQEN